MQKTDATIENVIEAENSRLLNLGELWHYRELLYFFTWRDVKIKYKQTVIGIFWAILQPIFMVAIFTVFFSSALKAPTSEIPYPLFAFSGLLMWNLFSSGLTNAGNSMIANAQIIKKVYFPRLVIPFAALVSSAFDFLMAFVVFVVMLLYYSIDVSWLQLLYLWPLSFLLAIVGTLGPGFLLSALNVKYRDFKYVIPFALQALFFLTPVIYSTSIFKQAWIQYVLALNPMYTAIHLFRQPLMPDQVMEPVLTLISITSTVFFFIIGIVYFKSTERYFADLA